MEKRSILIYLTFIGLSALIISGCAGYGKIHSDAGDGRTMTIDDLIKHSEEYEVYYSGMDIDNLSGILFNPKNSERNLKPSERWIRIADKKEVEEAVHWLKVQHGGGYYPRVRKVLGPDSRLYGYIFTYWNHIVAEVVDDKTLYVHDLPAPWRYHGPFPDNLFRAGP